MRFLLPLLSALLVPVVSSTLLADEPFPFLLSYDTPANATNIASWLDKPAGKHGPIRVVDGRLATDQGPLRLWAVNLCFEACFPDKKQAERLASRLARLGINCVRMHHMDSRSIWGNSENKTIIDPKQLKLLDHLIYQLKRNGIYTNLNLHVSRTLGEKEGFAGQENRPRYDKGLDNFEPKMIELQKKYARDLLTHVNPFTGLAYTEDPAIGFVEINNENALYHSWHRGTLNDLPSEYQTTFRRLWTDWLREKYGTTEALREAWQKGAVPLGEQMLENGDYSQTLDVGWHMEEDDAAQADWHVGRDGPTGAEALTVDVQTHGSVSWRPQFSHNGFALKKGKPYTVSFCARSDKPQRISVHAMMDHAPWHRLGLSTEIDLEPRWRQFRRVFIAGEDDENARLTFSQLSPGTYKFTPIGLKPGGIIGLRSYESFRGSGVPLMYLDRMDRTETAREDFAQFLWDTERDYWNGMYQFLKNDLGVQALVSGTQLGYSPVYLQAGLDYLDAHAYWQHPAFPGRPWDRENWNVRNVALVNRPGGTLTSLAARRVLGKPYTISEYNHPAPNSYGAEGFPMLAAYGGMQNWDGIYVFSYSHDTKFEPRAVNSFFDIKGDPTRLVHMPACHALFVRGDVAAAQETLAAPMSQRAEQTQLAESFNPSSLNTDTFGVDSLFALEHRIGLTLTGDQEQASRFGIARSDTSRYESDTSQLTWDLSKPVGGQFIANTPRTKLVTGFVSDKSFQLDEVRLRVGKTRLNWATLSMVCLDGESFARAGSVLVAATGWMQNSGAELEELGDDRVTLGAQWGRPPVLCEGVPFSVSLPIDPQRVRCYPLDEAGDRRAAVPPVAAGDRVEFNLTTEYKTLWYEIVIQ